MLKKIDTVFRKLGNPNLDLILNHFRLELLLQILIWGSIIIWGSTALDGSIISPTSILICITLPFLIAMKVLATKGYTGTVVFLLALFLLLIVDTALLLNDGIHDTAVILFPIGLLCISLFLSRASFGFVIVINALFLLTLGILEYKGVIVNRMSDHSDIVDITMVPVSFIMVATITRFITHTLNQAYITTRDQEQNYKALFNSSVTGIMINDLVTGKVIDCNQTILDMLQCSQNDLLTKDPNTFSGVEEGYTKERMQETALQKISAQNEVKLEWRSKRNDGTLFWSYISLKLIDLHNKKVIMAVVQDIDERKNNEIELVEYRKNLEKMVNEKTNELLNTQEELVNQAHKAGMAEVATGALHNVGNILTSVFISAEHIEQSILDGDFSKLTMVNSLILKEKEAGTLHQFFDSPQGDKLILYLIELETLYNSKIEQLGIELNRMKEKTKATVEVIKSQQDYAKQSYLLEDSHIDHLLLDVLNIVANTIEHNNIELKTDFAQIPTIELQKSKVIHILLNLLNNAIDALKLSPESNRVLSLTSEQSGTFILIRITDSGVGIKKEHLTQIFTHGFTTKEDGHGFGLHSCANYAQEMDGNLTVHSDGIGKGAQFTLSIPI
ncbi:MAG: ATP-binding protein [Fibrobacterales bacterium]